jgi:hypothetical protein
MLWVNIEEAERIQESAEDMTAAETAPSPKKETHLKLDSIDTLKVSNFSIIKFILARLCGFSEF